MLTDRIYKTKDVALFVGVNQRKIQLWQSRGLPLVPGLEGGGVQGKDHLYSFQNIMEFAMARAIIDAGMKPSVAFPKAAKFAYAMAQVGLFHPRLSGLPFHPDDGGDTLFAFHDSNVFLGFEPDSRGAWADMKAELVGPDGNEALLESYTSVNATAVLRGVCAKMGINANSFLDELYQRGPFKKNAKAC